MAIALCAQIALVAGTGGADEDETPRRINASSTPPAQKSGIRKYLEERGVLVGDIPKALLLYEVLVRSE